MGATVYYLIKAGKLMGVDHNGFNQALKGRISAQAATVGFIILGAWGLKRESYLRQIENEVITGMCFETQGNILPYFINCYSIGPPTVRWYNRGRNSCFLVFGVVLIGK